MPDHHPNHGVVAVLVAHGSRNPAAAHEHEALCSLVSARLEESGESVQVIPAFLELVEPSLAQAIDDAARQGAEVIRVVPHFLNSGSHVSVDLPRIIDVAGKAYPDLQISLDEHIGADPGLVSLIAGRIARPNVG